MSQRALAAAAGLKQPNLAAIESGSREPGPEMLARILTAARLRPSVALEMLALRVRELAGAYGLRDVRVFGSAAVGTDNESSDIDLLVTPDEEVDFLTLAAFRNAAQDLLGFPVDAVVEDGNNPLITTIRQNSVAL